MRNQTFGWRLKRLRMDLGMRQEDLRAELARITGTTVGATYISDLERSDKMPTLAMAAAIAKILGTTTDYLALLTDDAEPPHPQPERYITPEADRVARLMDAMPAADRNAILEVAERMAQPARTSSPRKADIDYMLQLIEVDLGPDARRRMERALLAPFDRPPGAGD